MKTSPYLLHIDTELQGDMLLVTGAGRLEFGEALRLFVQACETAAEAKVNKILVDSLGLEGELTALERYRFGVEVAAYLGLRQVNVKVAFVGKRPAMDGFGVRVAQNRGVITELFPTQQEALKWLNELRG